MQRWVLFGVDLQWLTDKLWTIRLIANLFHNRLICLSNFKEKKKSNYSDYSYLIWLFYVFWLGYESKWVSLGCGRNKIFEEVLISWKTDIMHNFLTFYRPNVWLIKKIIS